MTAHVLLMELGMPETHSIPSKQPTSARTTAFASSARTTRMLQTTQLKKKRQQNALLARLNPSSRLQEQAPCVPTRVGLGSWTLQCVQLECWVCPDQPDHFVRAQTELGPLWVVSNSLATCTTAHVPSMVQGMPETLSIHTSQPTSQRTMAFASSARMIRTLQRRFQRMQQQQLATLT
jgi:hypothetical protein